MKLDTRVEQALKDINFVERYENISKKYSRERTPKGEELDYFDGDFLMEIVELLAYKVHYDKEQSNAAAREASFNLVFILLLNQVD